MGKTKIERRNRRQIFEAEWKLGGFTGVWQLGIATTTRRRGVHIYNVCKNEFMSPTDVTELPLCRDPELLSCRVHQLEGWPQSHHHRTGVCKACIGAAICTLERRNNGITNTRYYVANCLLCNEVMPGAPVNACSKEKALLMLQDTIVLHYEAHFSADKCHQPNFRIVKLRSVG